MRYPDRKVVDNASRASMVDGDQNPAIAKANDFRLGPANHRKAEHFLIKLDGTLQIRNMNADVIDGCILKLDLILSGGGRSAGRQQGEAGNQFSTAQRAFLVAGQELGNDQFHGVVSINREPQKSGTMYRILC